MISSLEKITTLDICKSLITYVPKRENSTTTNYFRFQNIDYPVMNIIKVAMEFNDGFEAQGYNNLAVCKKILKDKLKINNDSFFNKKENKCST